MNKFDKPTEVTDAMLAFPGSVMDLMPAYADIPDEFKRLRGTWPDWQSDWFYSGLQRYPVAKEGINLKTAMRHLGCIQVSWDPKHEHKAAAVAYLASKWFSSPDGEPVEKKKQAA